MKWRTVASMVSLSMLLALSACGEGKKVENNSGVNIDTIDTKEGKGMELDAEYTEAMSNFSWDIFKELNREDENIFISPISISTALSMTYQGAEGNTKEQMQQALSYEKLERQAVNENYEKLLDHIEKVDTVDMNFANSVWIKSGQEIEESFVDTVRSTYKAYVEEIDFQKSDSADLINGWISDATNEKIDQMVQSPISSNIVLYLINAIYFNGEWTYEFDKEDTYKTEFNNGDGTKSNIEMMSRKGEVEYLSNEDYSAVRLPYGKDEALSMYLILPSDHMELDEFLDSIDADKWRAIREEVEPRRGITVEIPKFSLEYGIAELKGSLINLGMEEAFDERANLDGIREDISISSVLHKAVIDVNELGTEAAAATVVEIKETSIGEDQIFRADKPFLFTIVDEENDTILFMGSVKDME